MPSATSQILYTVWPKVHGHHQTRMSLFDIPIWGLVPFCRHRLSSRQAFHKILDCVKRARAADESLHHDPYYHWGFVQATGFSPHQTNETMSGPCSMSKGTNIIECLLGFKVFGHNGKKYTCKLIKFTLHWK